MKLLTKAFWDGLVLGVGQPGAWVACWLIFWAGYVVSRTGGPYSWYNFLLIASSDMQDSWELTWRVPWRPWESQDRV